ncbi:MAG TPA: SDR family NAD(P)-dependent oxidoreductase [Spirochaetota bacterium]|nr:SDR family NAD(P)-dependent oxidoreductase [Spirochaetota bacterium]HSA16557.1 SDR family NAD(P)-dependent oxidoreductase [Spirochaetota bacterium]
MKRGNDFAVKYGPWALVAGGSDGLGREFSMELARLGLNLVIVARRKELLLETAKVVTAAHPVQVRTITADLGDTESHALIIRETDDIDVGLLVYNAATSPIGPFLDTPIEKHAAAISTNCVGPVSLVHHFGRKMSDRGKGGIILMSSMTAFQGTPLVATYGSTKSFNLSLAESVGYELSSCGVDVMACCAGATLTPNYINSKPADRRLPSSAEMAPGKVVNEALRRLGTTRVLIPGRMNRFYGFIMTRILTRKQSISLIAKNLYRLYGKNPER